MAKKFGKFLLFTAAAGSAAAAIYCYMRKKDAAGNASEDEDYDDFTEDGDKASEASPNYVPLTPDPSDSSADEKGDTQARASQEETAEQDSQAGETVENFFEEEAEAPETSSQKQ